MDVVQQFLEARRQHDVDAAIDLISPNASISFPWGGQRSGPAAREYIRNEATFSHKEYLSSSVEIKEVAPNTFQRLYKWDKSQLETYNSGVDWANRLRNGSGLPTYREVYFVRDGKIAHVATNKDPMTKSLWHLISYKLNPFAEKGPIVLLQDNKQ